jgi:hypothetical protein
MERDLSHPDLRFGPRIQAPEIRESLAEKSR